MVKKKRTPAQLAADKARSEKMKQKPNEIKEQPEQIAPEQGTDEILRMVQELKEENALFKAALLGNQNGGVTVERNKLVGEIQRFVVDPADYTNPIERLADEQRLVAVNFKYNFELEYKFDTTQYETKTGINYVEPKFTIQLNRIKLDDQGAQTDGRIILRKLIFHEDPQAAMIIARENGLPIDENNQKDFLNEMRYLRVRDWLFDIFWPKPAQEKDQIREEVIGGTIVQVFTKNSLEPEAIDFDQLDTKVKA